MRRILPVLLLPSLVMAAQPISREITFKTPDGFTLHGTLTVPRGHGRHAAVILAHQFRSDRAGWAPLTEKLQDRGIATLALDLRGHGQSTDANGEKIAVGEDFMDSAKRVGFERIPQDLEQTAAWLRKQPGIDGRRLGLAGSSVGALSVLLAAPKVRPRAVLALSPAGNPAFGNLAPEALRTSVHRARTAVLLYASEQDTQAWANAKVLASTPGVCAKGTDGQGHGFDFLPSGSDTMAVFFGEYLRKPAPVRAKANVKTDAKPETKVLEMPSSPGKK